MAATLSVGECLRLGRTLGARAFLSYLYGLLLPPPLRNFTLRFDKHHPRVSRLTYIYIYRRPYLIPCDSTNIWAVRTRSFSDCFPTRIWIFLGAVSDALTCFSRLNRARRRIFSPFPRGKFEFRIAGGRNSLGTHGTSLYISFGFLRGG